MTRGECYAAAGAALMDAWMLGEADDLVLVHGRPTLQVEPFCEYGHAWIERTLTAGVLDGEEIRVVICRDAETGTTLIRELYYAVGKIDPAACFRYDFSALQRWVQKTGHWGPWEGPDACGPVEEEDEREEHEK